ncbi:MAG TPA: ATP-binding protein, partial [Thermohalobaculum sp.]|nr:ATP-binding protein [Thermohalobaculum sp.]
YELGIPGANAPLVVASLFAFLVLLLSYRSGRSYREGLKREADLARARDAAQKADRGKGTFLATVSHELRTPLNGMLGMTQTLLQSDLNPEQKAQVEVIAESGKALNALLTDILDFSKLEAGKLSIQPAEDNLRSIIDGLLRLYAPTAENKGLTLSATVLPTVPERLVFDAVRIRQCLSNLLSNAVKFTEAGGVHLQVRSEPAPGAPDGQERSLITVTVKDTGIGIAPDRQPFLFQPFSQADTSISRRFGGTGLGLSITRQLAESMGGTVSLHSIPGEGTEFQLSFLATMAQIPASGAKGRIAANDMSGHRVLVVDDVESNRMVMRLFLQPLGIEVIEAANAEAAFEALEHDNFDAVFLDLHLPGISGTEIARQLRREDSPHRDLPLIAVTADSSAPIDFMGPGGFDALIRKPVDHRDLQSTLFAATRGRGPRPGT